MGWDLTIDIDFSREPEKLIEALVNFLEPDIESVLVEVTRGEGTWKKSPEILVRENFDWDSNSLLKVTRLCQEGMQIGVDTCIQVWFGLHGRGELGSYDPVPEVYFFGPQYSDGGEYRHGLFCDATLYLGNHTAYKGEYNLPVSGRCLDREFITQLLKHICYEIQPKNLYLEHEQGANVPWNHHFIFHNSPEGYAQDLFDLIQLGLYGGDERYKDSRRNYQASVSPTQKMMFGRRDLSHINTLQSFLLTYGAQLERKGVPTTFSREYLEDSVLYACSISEENDPLIDFFFVGDGLGVYAQPLLNRYCESIFLSLISGLTDKEDNLAVVMS